MQVTIRQASNTLTPALRTLCKSVADKRGLHEAIGIGLISLTKRAFKDSALRPANWLNKKDDTACHLTKSGTLAKSVRVTEVSEQGVTLGSDRKYAAIHQLGGKTKPHIIRGKKGQALKLPFGYRMSVKHPGSQIPARPYLPFDSAGRPSAAARQMIEQVIRARVGKSGPA